MTASWSIFHGFWTTNTISKSQCLEEINDRNWSVWQLQTLLMLQNVSWMIRISSKDKQISWTNLVQLSSNSWVTTLTFNDLRFYYQCELIYPTRIWLNYCNNFILPVILILPVCLKTNAPTGKGVSIPLTIWQNNQDLILVTIWNVISCYLYRIKKCYRLDIFVTGNGSTRNN